MENSSVELRRIRFLDALRGLAVLFVVLWHAYGSTYAEYLPFGTRYSVIPVRVMWVGLELFFLISGFVILMTLERSRNLASFATRRWLRLFPAMLIASTVTLAFDVTLDLGPSANRTLINLLPGLLFISPSLIHTLTGVVIQSMDDPYWTLYVEVLFYAIFGTAFFLIGRTRAIGILASLYLLSYSSNCLAKIGVGGHLVFRVAAAMDWLGLIQFGWFCTGALFFLYYQRPNHRTLVIATSIGIFCALAAKPAAPLAYGFPERVALISVVMVFAGLVFSQRAQHWISFRALTFLGFISYPLYLLHDNIMIGTTRWLGQRMPTIPLVLTPIAPILLVVTISWLIASYAEPAIRSLLRWQSLRGAGGLSR